MHGNRDIGAGFWIALRNQINRLAERETRRFEREVRAGYVTVGILIAVALGLIVYLLTN